MNKVSTELKVETEPWNHEVTGTKMLIAAAHATRYGPLNMDTDVLV